MADFTLTATGLQTPRFVEARTLVVTRWKAKFGDNAQTASDTPDGLIIDVIALVLTLVWDGVASVYASSFFLTAVGVPLDLILDLFGRRRLEARASTASCVWYGDANTTISGTPPSSASVEDTKTRFDVDAAGVTTTAGGGGPMVVRIITAVDGETYAIDVSTTSESTTVAGGSSSPASIADALATQLATDNPTATVSRGGEDPDGTAVIVLEGLGAGVVTVGGSATTPASQDVRFGVRLGMTAQETGPSAALVGNLNTIETPISGIDGVCNTDDATVGRNIETDPDFRARHLDTLNSGGAGSVPAIRARILDRLGDDVQYVRVFENDTFATVDGRPPKSFETVWIGTAGTATEEAVAAEILQAKPAGIQPFGSLTTVVNDAQGTPRNIGHSRGAERYLHLDIIVTAGEGFPTTGDPEGAIEAAVVAYLDEGGAGELGLGSDFYRFQLGTPIGAAVAGIASVVITADDTANPGDTPTLTASDVAVAEGSILRVDSSRVSVSIAP